MLAILDLHQEKIHYLTTAIPKFLHLNIFDYFKSICQHFSAMELFFYKCLYCTLLAFAYLKTILRVLIAAYNPWLARKLINFAPWSQLKKNISEDKLITAAESSLLSCVCSVFINLILFSLSFFKSNSVGACAANF